MNFVVKSSLLVLVLIQVLGANCFIRCEGWTTAGRDVVAAVVLRSMSSHCPIHRQQQQQALRHTRAYERRLTSIMTSKSQHDDFHVDDFNIDDVLREAEAALEAAKISLNECNVGGNGNDDERKIDSIAVVNNNKQQQQAIQTSGTAASDDRLQVSLGTDTVVGILELVSRLTTELSSSVGRAVRIVLEQQILLLVNAILEGMQRKVEETKQNIQTLPGRVADAVKSSAQTATQAAVDEVRSIPQKATDQIVSSGLLERELLLAILVIPSFIAIIVLVLDAIVSGREIPFLVQ